MIRICVEKILINHLVTGVLSCFHIMISKLANLRDVFTTSVCCMSSFKIVSMGEVSNFSEGSNESDLDKSLYTWPSGLIGGL